LHAQVPTRNLKQDYSKKIVKIYDLEQENDPLMKPRYHKYDINMIIPVLLTRILPE